MRDKGRIGFTLIELVIVILIIGILAVALIPKMQNLANQAVRAQEDAIIAALRIAIETKHIQDVANGGDPDLYPDGGADLFATFLENPPPHKVIYVDLGPFFGYWDLQTQGDSAWYIQCPHNFLSTTKGRAWVYTYKDLPSGYGRIRPGGTTYSTCV